MIGSKKQNTETLRAVSYTHLDVYKRQTLSGAQWFSTLDLKSGYWQVGLHLEDKENTAFSTPSGLFQFNVMPFGLCNAPTTFKRLMDLVLRGLTWKTYLGKPKKEEVKKRRGRMGELRGINTESLVSTDQTNTHRAEGFINNTVLLHINLSLIHI